MTKSEKDYKAVLEKVEELFAIPENIEDPGSKGYLELNQLAVLVAVYEKNTWLRNELIEGMESSLSTKTMAEFMEKSEKN